jgi:hypothetical protein
MPSTVCSTVDCRVLISEKPTLIRLSYLSTTGHQN